MISLWSDTAKMPHFEKLQGDAETDILIIGGGMAGILCAYELQKKDADYILIEANEICGGITKNTTAKITSQHGFIYDTLIKKYGLHEAKLYLESNENAVKKFTALCENTDCYFKICDNIVYSYDKEKIEKELEALEGLGFNAQRCEDIPLPFSVMGAIRFKNQAQFNPLKFIAGISKDLRIYEHTKALELQGMTTVTQYGKIKAKKIIIATHFPILNKHGLYFMKLYQHRSYVIALENAEKLDEMYVDEAQCGMSFRSADDFLLIGGGDHRTGKNGGNFTELESFKEKYYPEAKIRYRWATQDCMSLDGIPYIGQYSKNTPDLFTATGFNKWGMSSSMVSAEILADLVQGKNNRYAELYSPSRSMLHGQLFVNAAETLISFLTPTKKRCPHMGCALKYNKDEHSWDCPCHGSRFNEEGELIDNPATDDMKK